MGYISVLHSKSWAIGFGTLLVLSLLVWIGLPHWRPHVLHGFAMQPPKPAADFTLTAHTGERVSLHDFRGKLLLLYFGYTFCPGICPTTLANVAQVLQRLGARANQVRLPLEQTLESLSRRRRRAQIAARRALAASVF